MLLNHKEKCKVRQRAVLEAIRICGGVAAFSQQLNINRSRASNWVHQPDLSIPYEYVILIENITKVSLARLSPFTEAANKAVKHLRDPQRSPTVTFFLDKILVGDPMCYRRVTPNRMIIVGTDRILVSGLAQMECYKKAGMQKIQIVVLDLESLVLEMRSLKDFNYHFLVSELVAIGLRLEQLLGLSQDKQKDLNPAKNPAKNTAGRHDSQLHHICNKAKEDHIAHILGFPNKDSYYRAREIYLTNDTELIDRLDKEQVMMPETLAKPNLSA